MNEITVEAAVIEDIEETLSQLDLAEYRLTKLLSNMPLRNGEVVNVASGKLKVGRVTGVRWVSGVGHVITVSGYYLDSDGYRKRKATGHEFALRVRKEPSQVRFFDAKGEQIHGKVAFCDGEVWRIRRDDQYQGERVMVLSPIEGARMEVSGANDEEVH